MVSPEMLLGLLGTEPAVNVSSDGFVSPGLALVDVVRGLPPPMNARLDPARVRGRPIYMPLVGYALARSGVHDSSIHNLARERADSRSAVGVWWALNLCACGEDCDVFPELVERQLETGEFFAPTPAYAPDLHWYDELCVLHAVASFATLRGDRDAMSAVKRAALFHTAETQPDHATSQPWAVHAFARWQETMPLAELLLHGALSQHAGRLDAVGRILIADAVLGMNEAGKRADWN